MLEIKIMFKNTLDLIHFTIHVNKSENSGIYKEKYHMEGSENFQKSLTSYVNGP